MLTASLLMAPLWLASGSVGTAYEAGLRAELRNRPAESRAADLELVPAVGLEHIRDTVTLTLRYTPRLRMTLEPGARVQAPNLLNVGALELAWRPDTLTTVRAVQQASYGVNEFDPLAAPLLGDVLNGGQQGLDPRPVGPVRRYVSSDTGLAWSRELSLRSRLSLSGRYQVSGSLDPESRSALPLQHGPSAEARYGYQLSRRDQLETVASANHARFSSDESALGVAVTQGWRRQLTRTLDGHVAAGAAALRSVSPGAPAAPVRTLPAAEAGLGYTPLLQTAPFSARVTARLAPFIDRVSGEAYGRAEADLALGWSPLTWLQLSTRAAAARSLQGGAGAQSQLASVEASATYQSTPALAVSAGGRGAWDTRALEDGQTQRRFDAGAFVTLTLFTREVL
jgi:hypothetical protein